MAKKLAVYDSNTKRLEALDPGQATAVGIPAFQSGPVLPPVPSMDGIGFYNTSSGEAYIGTNGAWRSVVPSALLSYTDETTLLADLAPAEGSYAVAKSTGNLFIKSAAGWHQVGVRNYATVTNLLADSPPDGDLGFATDESTLWVRAGGAWACLSRRPFNAIADLTAWTPANGAEAILVPHGLLFVRAQGNWYPKSVWLASEATILADTTSLVGQIGIATDTGRMFVWNGTIWVGSPVRHYATEVDLLADMPAVGTVAFADDTGHVFGYATNGWQRSSTPNITVGATAPASPVNGDFWIDTATAGVVTLKVYANGSWTGPSGLPPGGTAGQWLSKVDATDGNARWENPTRAWQVNTAASLSRTAWDNWPIGTLAYAIDTHAWYIKDDTAGHTWTMVSPGVFYGTSATPPANAPDGSIYIKY